MDLKEKKEKARNYYDQESDEYYKLYEEEQDLYPSDLIRLNFIVKRLKEMNVKTILDAGCGSCEPMVRLLNEGFKVKGFDFSPGMVEAGKKILTEAGYSPDLVRQADLEDANSPSDEQFDAVICLGVITHIPDQNKAIRNINKMLKPEGVALIQFRNDLFSVFTMNQYSQNFFLGIIPYKEMNTSLQNDAQDFYSQRFKSHSTGRHEKGNISYSEILADFTNPLTIERDLFTPNGFVINKLHWYHFHALPPVFEQTHKDEFRKLSMAMENIDDWKGYLMASAFVVEAKKCE